MRARPLSTTITRRDLRTALLTALATLLVSAGVATAAITGSGIRDGSIWGRDIADGSVTGLDVRNGSVTSIDVANGSLHNVDLRDGTITGEKIQNGSVSSVDIANGALSGRDIGDGSLSGADLGAGTISAAHLAFGVVTRSEFEALGAPGFVNVATNPVDWTKIKNMPAAFADGVDAAGGTADDIACTGCVDSTDLADGTVVLGDLAFDPATQGELDALGAAGIINTGSNPVDWTKLKGVPAGLADGVDSVDGGTAADLSCPGCVSGSDVLDNTLSADDIATGAVGTDELANGTVAIVDLAFDPATQTELDALATGDGTINEAGDDVHWTKLAGVPAEIADGDDAIDGGTAAGLTCTGCVDSTDLATGAVEGIDILDGTIAVGDLGFDPATQLELDALGTNLASAGTINTAGNPVNWTKLLGVPVGLHDGTDDTVEPGFATAATETVNEGAMLSMYASCSPGDTAIGGGYEFLVADASTILIESMPDPLDPERWMLTFYNAPNAGGNVSINPKAVCLGAVTDS